MAAKKGKPPIAHVRETFERLEADWTLRLRDHTFERCSFINGAIWQKKGHWAEVERLTFQDCKLQNRGIGNVICRDIRLRNVRRNPTFVLRNCLFDRVTFEGDFGSWFFMWLGNELSDADVAHASKFYERVDFALDVRGARFKSLTLRGVPGDLVLRDPETSILVRRSVLEPTQRWREAPGAWAQEFELFLRNRPRWEAAVYCADALSSGYEADLEAFSALRRAGFAE